MTITDFVKVLDTLYIRELDLTVMTSPDRARAKQAFVTAANKALAEALKDQT